MTDIRAGFKQPKIQDTKLTKEDYKERFVGKFKGHIKKLRGIFHNSKALRNKK